MAPTIETPIPYEESVKPWWGTSRRKFLRSRSRPLKPGDDYVRRNQLVRTVETQHFNGKQIPVVTYARESVVKQYAPPVGIPWESKYQSRVSLLRASQLVHLARRLMNRTDRLRKRLDNPERIKKFKPAELQVLNVLFFTMAKQLEHVASELQRRGMLPNAKANA